MLNNKPSTKHVLVQFLKNKPQSIIHITQLDERLMSRQLFIDSRQRFVDWCQTTLNIGRRQSVIQKSAACDTSHSFPPVKYNRDSNPTLRHTPHRKAFIRLL